MTPPLDLTDTTAEHIDPLTVLRFVPHAAKRVLDCGGASGPLPERLAQRHAVSLTCANVINPGDRAVRTISSAPAAYDCITCVDVAPRVRDAEPLAQELARVLAPGGVLLMTVPNVQFYRIVLALAHGHWQAAEGGVLDPSHIRFFTAFEAAELLRRHGLHIEAIIPIAGTAPETVPRDAGGHINAGEIRLGPLTDDEYKVYMTSQFLVMATKPSPA